jgi:RNA-directed DNA polymerase
MYHYLPHKTDLNSSQLKAMALRFEQLRNPAGLAQLLGVTETAMRQQLEKQPYQCFHVPKPGGQKRSIQNPGPALKSMQQTLNKYLQAWYYSVRPDAAQGFVLTPSDDPRPRNIYTNAFLHCKSEWFLNIDIKDFFHSITLTHLRDLFREIFGFPPELSQALIQLSAYQGRLPMGAPSSPILSNLVCLVLDYQLMQLAQSAQAVYTRYADDLSFSFPKMPPPDFVEQVLALIMAHGFSLNVQKFRLQNRMEEPEITGLIIGKGPAPTLSKAWLKRLKEEIRILRWLNSEAVRERGLFHAFVFEKFRESIRGQIAFVGFVSGKDSRTYRKLAGKIS